jgi:CDP-diacylglycerol---serine O-phosphatidyltransferase
MQRNEPVPLQSVFGFFITSEKSGNNHENPGSQGYFHAKLELISNTSIFSLSLQEIFPQQMHIKKHIPNAITCMNLVCGCLAITFVINGRLTWAGWAILAAAVFDFFDGFAARLLHAGSETGKQLDSLADVVSFGVAPGMIMLQLMHLGEKAWGFQIPDIFFYAALLIPVCAAIRLAKFNTDPGQKDSFSGLPSPAAGIFVAALPMMLARALHSPVFPFNDYLFHFVLHPATLFASTFLLSLLMVSNLPMFSLKFKTWGWRHNTLRYVFIFVSLLLIAVFFFTAIPAVIILYILISAIQSITGNKYKTDEIHSRN